jgi:hypothetical protein
MEGVGCNIEEPDILTESWEKDWKCTGIKEVQGDWGMHVWTFSH